MSMGYIDVVNVSKVYRGRVVALRNVSISIEASLHVVIGPNGSGKSTLIDIIAGVRRPTSGYVRVLGLDPLKDADKLRSRASFLLDRARLPPFERVSKFLEYVAQERGLDPKEIYYFCRDSLGIEYLDRRCYELSAGMAKKVLLCATLAGDPELVVMDEPFTNLDPYARARLVELILMRKRRGLKTVIATHILYTLDLELDDSITFLVDGAVLVHGKLSDIANSIPGVAYVETKRSDAKILELCKSCSSFTVEEDKMLIPLDAARRYGIEGLLRVDLGKLYRYVLEKHSSIHL